MPSIGWTRGLHATSVQNSSNEKQNKTVLSCNFTFCLRFLWWCIAQMAPLKHWRHLWGREGCEFSTENLSLCPYAWTQAVKTEITCILAEATYSNSYIHKLMAMAAMQGADQHMRSSLGFSILPKDTSTCTLGDSNQQPFYYKTLALPLSRLWLFIQMHITEMK